MQLIHGDCLDVMGGDLIADKSVDLILCDLPYGTTACKWDVVIPFEPLWNCYKRIIKDRGAIVLFGGEPFSSLLRISNLPWFKYDWIWDKPHGTGFLNAKKQPIRAHECISVFCNGSSDYYPQKTSGHIRKTATKRKDETPIYGQQKGEHSYDSTERFPRTIQQFSSDKQKSNLHPTQKPVALLEYLIKTYSREGETVLDNCFGSGSTGIACLNTGRNFIGIEKDDHYFKVASERIANHQAKLRQAT